MKKPIVAVPILLLVAAVGWFGWRMLSGSDNDSPIIITDSSTQPMGEGKDKKPETTAEHEKGFGKNPKNHYQVHDKKNSTDYLPGCLVFGNNSPVAITSGTSSFQIDYTKADGSGGNLMTWVRAGDAENDPGDVTMGSGFTSHSAKTLKLPVTIANVTWTLGAGTSSPLPASSAMPIVVRYCPGGNCVNDAGTDKCK